MRALSGALLKMGLPAFAWDDFGALGVSAEFCTKNIGHQLVQ